ncbi:hypothetical protein BDY21DRAFT_374435 [Lineolata rhizophorae]|uniref:Uncharacterized protein n=1 Tax=Lineolata rhizophorae TaxID=578093 RepID=A0A6A6NQ26_9PEZI|nr:hypothetical protein BDY21DRAFT_374435 [Lineolata rhizophorae]
MTTTTASSRLRRAFKYPEDSDSDAASDAAGLDEQQQEHLIAGFRERDARMTSLANKAFLALPLVAALPYLAAAFGGRGGGEAVAAAPTAGAALAMVLALLCTAAGQAVRVSPGLGNAWVWVRHASVSAIGDGARVEGYKVRDVARWASWVAGGVLSVLALRTAWMDGCVRLEGWWAYVPVAVWWFMNVGTWVLKPVDVEGLEKLRYGYKGA